MNSPTHTDILLITPPLTQINTPYPATPYLKGFLNERGINSFQVDLGIELILEIFSEKGLKRIFADVRSKPNDFSDHVNRVLALEKDYLKTIKPVIRFLQNRDSTLAYRICNTSFLPEGYRFQNFENIDDAFGSLGLQDRARFLATLYLNELSDFIKETISSSFGFSKYAERIAVAATDFQRIDDEINKENTIIDEMLFKILRYHLDIHHPELIGFTIPFPGCLYGALQCCRMIRNEYLGIKTVFGGGYVSTELRSLTNKQIFNYVDFIVLDEGERPFLQIIDFIKQTKDTSQLKKTFCFHNGKLRFFDNPSLADFKFSEIGTPDYHDLQLHKYLSVLETANPMHRLWNDGRWNKLTIAHGCYWKRCTFCDVSLNYICQFEKLPANTVVDKIEKIVADTGQTGFHFTDEAAPPDVLKEIALELLRRNISITWWTNIRFEKRFTYDLCQLLSASGCIAVAGGLEVASDRLLKKMKKGVTISQAANTANNFKRSGILVHAYLMYGFPSETKQDTVDALEIVRQLFALDCIQSGFWHRFTLTAHSPMGMNPAEYGIKVTGPQRGDFAYNDLIHNDPLGCNHDQFSSGLEKALFNFMLNIGIEYDVGFWFDFSIPDPTIPKNYIHDQISLRSKKVNLNDSKQLLWLHSSPEISYFEKRKKGKSVKKVKLIFHSQTDIFEFETDLKLGEWLNNTIFKFDKNEKKELTLGYVEKLYESTFNSDFTAFCESPIWKSLLENGLLLI